MAPQASESGCLQPDGEEGEAGQRGERDRVPLGPQRQSDCDSCKGEAPATVLGLAHGSGALPEGDREERDHEHVEHRDARVDEHEEPAREQEAVGECGVAVE